jgi:hypothetical protein
MHAELGHVSAIWHSMATSMVIRAGAQGRFYNVVDLVNRLETEARTGRQGRLADYLTRVDNSFRGGTAPPGSRPTTSVKVQPRSIQKSHLLITPPAPSLILRSFQGGKRGHPSASNRGYGHRS